MPLLLRASWALASARDRARRWKRGASFGPRIRPTGQLSRTDRTSIAPMARWVTFHMGPAKHVLAQVGRGPALLDPPVDASRGPRASSLSPPVVGPRVRRAGPTTVRRAPSAAPPPPVQAPAPAEEAPAGMMLDPFAGLLGGG